MAAQAPPYKNNKRDLRLPPVASARYKQEALAAAWYALHPTANKKTYNNYLTLLFQRADGRGFSIDPLCAVLNTGLHPIELATLLFSVPEHLQDTYVQELARELQTTPHEQDADLYVADDDTILSSIVTFLAEQATVTTHPYLPPHVALAIARLDARRRETNINDCDDVLREIIHEFYIKPNAAEEDNAIQTQTTAANTTHAPLLIEAIEWLTARELESSGSNQIRTLRRWFHATLLAAPSSPDIRTALTNNPKECLRNLFVFAQSTQDVIYCPHGEKYSHDRNDLLLDICQAPETHRLFKALTIHSAGTTSSWLFNPTEWALLKKGYASLNHQQQDLLLTLLHTMTEASSSLDALYTTKALTEA